MKNWTWSSAIYDVWCIIKRLENQNKFIEELEGEVSQKATHIEQLDEYCNQLSLKMEKLEELRDLQD